MHLFIIIIFINLQWAGWMDFYKLNQCLSERKKEENAVEVAINKLIQRGLPLNYLLMFFWSTRVMASYVQAVVLFQLFICVFGECAVANMPINTRETCLTSICYHVFLRSITMTAIRVFCLWFLLYNCLMSLRKAETLSLPNAPTNFSGWPALGRLLARVCAHMHMGRRL